MAKVAPRRAVHAAARPVPLHAARVASRRQRRVARWLLASVLLIVMALGGVVAALRPWRSASLPPPAPNGALARIFARHDIVAGMPYVYPTAKVDYLYTDGLGNPPWVPVRTYRVLGHWLHSGDAMPQLPPWVDANLPRESGPVWAPAVIRVGQHYVMWFSAPWADPHPYQGLAYPKCIGYALAASPLGPFRNAKATEPELCQRSEHGSIDPQPIRINGQWWLYWKSDNNADPKARHTKIWAQRLAADGTTLLGQPRMIYENHNLWEGEMVESPAMVVHDHHYYLFYSGNSSWVPEAGIGLAVCASPAGPCHSPFNGPFIGSNVLGEGPSEVRTFTQDGNTWLLYTPEATYYRGELAQLAVSRVAFGPKGPYDASFEHARPGP